MQKDLITEGCQAVIDLVQEKLGFLFRDYNFEIIHQEDAKIGERCLFVFESQACRLRVISEFGSVGIEIGSMDSPISWSATSCGTIEWFSIDSVLEFLKGIKPTIEEIRQRGKEIWSMSTEEQLADLETRFKPVAKDIFTIFNKENYSTTRNAIESFYSR